MLIDDIYLSFKNKTRENIKWKMVGDMYRRMDYILEHFQGIETITEFGPFQGCSTAAWLMLRPKKFTTVDKGVALDIDTFSKAARELGVDFNFIIGDDTEIEIDPCELLFIDTTHTEDHTYLELSIHAHKVSKFLVFHDINESRFTTLKGINRWWIKNPEWKLYYQDFDDCGFMVLKKQDD